MLRMLGLSGSAPATEASVDQKNPTFPIAKQAARVDAVASASLQGGDVQGGDVKVTSFGSMAPRSPTAAQCPDLTGLRKLFEGEGSPTAAPAATGVEAGAPADVLGASLAVHTGFLADSTQATAPSSSLNTSLTDKAEGEAPIAPLEEAAAHVDAVASASIAPTPPASSRLYTAAVFPLQVVAWPVRTIASGLWSGASYMIGRKPV